MNKLLITGCLLATAFAAVAMPTKKELAAAQKLVEDVIAPDVKALNAGRKTVKDVADTQMKLAADAQSEAEKYLLLQSAFKLYSRGEEFDSAAKALTAITRDIKDVPPELIVELIDKEFHRGMGQKAPKEIEAAVRDAERLTQVKAEKPQREVMRTDLYCVIDISGGPNAEHYPVSYIDAVPEGGWTDEYKTTKIVLRRIEAGTWPMMGNRRVTFTKPFYIGIFELTQKQIKLMSGMPDRKFVFAGDMRPADCLSWEEMRGKDEEFDYPKTKEVAPDSIIGKLRAKTGLSRIDLQTSYQFGCAWNAGTDGKGRDARLTGRHFSNRRDGKGGYNLRHTVVGSYPPNEWGIYDLHGNVWEVCLDRLGLRSSETDPEGPVEGERRRNMLGGCWNSADRFVFAKDCVPNTKDKVGDSGKCGYRIVINAMPDEIKDAE